MNFSELVFNKNILKMFSNPKEPFKNIIEDLSKKKEKIENEIKKQIGGMNETTFWGLISLIIIILILFPLGLTYIIKPEIFEN